jgi:uncharacterized protein YjbI with pentapeptide repeats
MAKNKRHLEEELRKKGAERVEKGKSFEEKTGEIFKLKGFEVEFNPKWAGYEIDIFLKKRKSIGKEHEYYICECKDWHRNIDQEVVTKSFAAREGVKKKLIELHKGKQCEAIIVSSKGFADEAKKAAESHDIILYTYDELLSELMDFNRYLSGLIQSFESDPLYHLYIEQDFFPERSMEEINSFKFVKEWLKKPDRKQFSLLGDYGTGKTSFAKKLAYKMAKEYKKDPGSVRIPFLVDLRQCRKALSLHTLLLEQLKNAGIEPVNADIFLKLLAEGKILLIFDAFDEMATMSNAEITLNNFRQLNQAVTGEAKVILTSRTHYFRDKFEVDKILKKQGVEGLSPHATMLLREVYDKPEYEIVYLKEFTPDQVKAYLEKALKDKWQEAYNKIKSIYNLEDLSTRPVLLDMIVKTLPKIHKKRMEEFSVVHLYEVFTYSWFERDDYRLQITKQGKEELVEALAYKLWKEGEKSIHYTALSGILSGHLKSKIKTSRDLEHADYEVRTASFLVRDDEGNYGFAHKSFQEFFIARKIKKELEKKNYRILDLRRLSIEIIFFLRLLMNDDSKIIQAMVELLTQKYKKNISENALLLFYNIIKMGYLKRKFSLRENILFSLEKKREFRTLLESYLPSKINLQNADLNGITLTFMIFRNANISEANLEMTQLKNCIFENVDLKRSNLRGSDFSHSSFKNTKFVESYAHSCTFEGCEFRNCQLVSSTFNNSNFLNSFSADCIIDKNKFENARSIPSHGERMTDDGDYRW